MSRFECILFLGVISRIRVHEAVASLCACVGEMSRPKHFGRYVHLKSYFHAFKYKHESIFV